MDTIFRGVYNYEYFKQIYNCLYEEVINKSYMYPENFNKQVLVKYNLPYDVYYYLFVDNYNIVESCNAEPEFIKPHIVPVKNLSPSNYLKNYEKPWFNSFTKFLTKLINDYNNKCENKADKPKTIKIKGIRIDRVSGYRNLTLKPKYKEKVDTSITNIENQNEKSKNTETEINPKKLKQRKKRRE